MLWSNARNMRGAQKAAAPTLLFNKRGFAMHIFKPALVRARATQKEEIFKA